jgi:tartrate dehydrogenase/decarboxylase/D-malate dehydrogenase
LVRRPWDFDVIVASNLFGDILSDLAAAVQGSLGMAPSANVTDMLGVPGLFEPVHGSAPDIAGRGIANPIGTVLAGAMMFDHLQMPEAAHAVRRGVDEVVAQGLGTPDIGGTLTTAQFADRLARELEVVP